MHFFPNTSKYHRYQKECFDFSPRPERGFWLPRTPPRNIPNGLNYINSPTHPSTNPFLGHAAHRQHNSLRSHVSGGVDSLGQSGDGNRESLLDLLKDLLVGVARDKGDGKTLGTESTSTTNSVEIRVGIRGCVLCRA